MRPFIDIPIIQRKKFRYSEMQNTEYDFISIYAIKINNYLNLILTVIDNDWYITQEFTDWSKNNVTQSVVLLEKGNNFIYEIELVEVKNEKDV